LVRHPDRPSPCLFAALVATNRLGTRSIMKMGTFGDTFVTLEAILNRTN
jgi:hypothetical protein